MSFSTENNTDKVNTIPNLTKKSINHVVKDQKKEPSDCK